MKMKILCNILGVYSFIMVVCTLVFIAFFHTSLFSSIDVFFYRGVIFLFISSFVSALLMLILKKYIFKNILDNRDIVAIYLVFLGFTSTWFVLLPVTVERSISVYMLSYMDENSDYGISSKNFGKIFYQKYINDYGAFEKRFAEQLTSKNIERYSDGDGYVITENGRRIVNLFRMCAYVFNTEKWLVYPNEYEGKYSNVR